MLRLSAAALRSYTRWYGPYGRKELDLVEGPGVVARGAGIGMEYPELVLTPAQALVVRHEVAHQWWYGIVGNDEYARAVARRELRDLLGRTPRRRRERLRAAARQAAADRVDEGFERAPRSAYRRVVYLGGSCALSTLERRLGRARFDRMLRGVVREHRDGILTTAGFVAAVRAAAPPGVDAAALLRRAGIVCCAP